MKSFVKTEFQILLFFLFISFPVFSQDIAINEIMTSNDATIADENGDFEDWIEIYNYGTVAVDLSGYGLSDEVDNAFKWVFPAVTIPAKGFLLVWASDKNKTTASQPLHTNFKIKSGGEAVILTKPGGVLISEVPATALAADTSYGRSPDGTGSWQVYTTATPNDSNTGATQAPTEKIAINEILTSNVTNLADEDGEYNDWIEIYNYGTTSVNLGGYGLSDDTSLPYKWVFPSTVIGPNEYILVWASDKNKVTSGQPLHTNFKISSGGETINLTNTSGVLVSGSPSIALDADVSYGKQPDGTGSWFFFNTPTPLATNTNTGSVSLPKPPTFSHDSGLYSDAFNLTLTNNQEGATIVYTTDGSEPDINNLSGTSFSYKNDYPFEIGESVGPLLSETYISKTYSSPISITDRSNDPDRLAVKNTVQNDIFIPPTPVRKATIVKARTFIDGVGSETIAKTFFVWNGVNPYNTPVISLQLNERHLFDYEDGIYTAGIDFDTWRAENPNGNQPGRPSWNNYWRSGRDWEKPVNVEIFDSNLESVESINAGLRIHGKTSRGDVIKNLRLYARSEYDDKNEFEHNLFDQQIPNATSPYNNDFKRIMLRGNGSGGYIANDVVFHRLMQPFWNGVSRIRTAVHFFNGEYWGLTALRDRFDSHHFANNFDLNSDDIVILDCKGGRCVLDEGENSDYSTYIDLVNYIGNNDMSIPANYAKVETELDIDSYINHVMLEIFAEGDSYEIKFWKTKTKVDDGFGDGKWRLITHDFENALNHRVNWLEQFTDKTNSAELAVLANLVDNETFKVKFINRFADLLNTGYKKDRFDAIVNETFEEIAPLLDEDRNRSPRLRFYGSGDKTRLLEWIEERPLRLRNQINSLFGIDNTVDLDLNVSDNKAGHIKINTINVNGLTPGVDENPYPWTGVYFKGIPVTLEAKTKPGYVFTHWSGDVNSTASTITVSPTANMQIQANYDPIDDFSHLVYFWLFDSNIENDTPLEQVNATYSRDGLNSQIVYTSSLSGYPFTSESPNWRKASLERKNAPTSINYSAFANNETPYASEIMRGLQVKQPFKSGSLENTIQLNLATTNFKEIKVSFAINSDGAAQSLIVDYWNGSNWIATNISYSPAITAQYEKKEIDFSNVTLADNNPSFKVRIRFGGANMTADEDKVVLLNNIAVEGIETALSTETFDAMQDLKVFPNPTNDQIKIQASQVIDAVSIYNVFGKLVYRDATDSSNLLIDMSTLSSGVYLLKILSNNTTMNRKIIKK